MIKWIISGFLLALTLIFVSIKSVWAGFIYLSVICLSLLCLYWVYVRLKLYKRDYKTNFEKAFISYKADYINSNNVSSADFEKNLQEHYKQFKKRLRKEKFIDLFKIAFILAIFVACVVAIIKL